MRILRIGTIVLMMLFLSGAAVAAEAPVYKDGDWWVFKVKSNQFNGEYKITHKDGKFESEEPRLLDANVLVTVNLSSAEKKLLDFPLVPGKKWNFRVYTKSATAGRSGWRYAEVEVIGPSPQLLETPGGKFKTMEIRRKDTFLSSQTDVVYFYSPEAKSVVKLSAVSSSPQGGESRIESELIKYSVQ